MMEYDTHLFIDIIESIQGIIYIREDSKDGFSIRVYQGLNGRLVIIDSSEEFITEEMGRGYLLQLGIDYLIPSLFPVDKNINDHPIDHYCNLESSKILLVKFHDKEEVFTGRIIGYEVNSIPYPLKHEKLLGRFKIISDIDEYRKNRSLTHVNHFYEINLTKDKIIEIIEIDGRTASI